MRIRCETDMSETVFGTHLSRFAMQQLRVRWPINGFW
jgi:hypothetical protein